MSKSISKHYGVLLTIAYDGTSYSGWQEQPNQKTIQGAIKNAIRKADPAAQNQFDLFGASRTDAGVHALGQLASFRTKHHMHDEAWRHAIGNHLNPSISITKAQACNPDYNPRFDTKRKTYRYLIEVGRSHNPLNRNQVWHIGHQLAREDIKPDQRKEELDHWFDLNSMKAAASNFVGTFDFKAFQSANDYRTMTTRTIESVTIHPNWHNNPRLCAIEIIGNAFLKNMVRIMIGTLVEIGRNRFLPNRIAQLLSTNKERKQAGPTAPAQGLYLVNVELGRRQSNDE